MFHQRDDGNPLQDRWSFVRGIRLRGVTLRVSEEVGPGVEIPVPGSAEALPALEGREPQVGGSAQWFF